MKKTIGIFAVLLALLLCMGCGAKASGTASGAMDFYFDRVDDNTMTVTTPDGSATQWTR